MQRIDPHVAVRMLSPFHSQRVTPIRLIAIHATESPEESGSLDLAAIGNWFQNPQAQVSAHVCTDASLGMSARYVDDHLKAWHVANYNSYALGIEQIGHTAQAKWQEPEIHETARWVARWSLMYGIPIQHGEVSGGSVVKAGVVRHQDLGQIGGGHGDPGNPYPLHELLGLSSFYRTKLIERARHHA
jgi:N-acetyl-anhydromuramyl-L-alanine amidase AmpD